LSNDIPRRRRRRRQAHYSIVKFVSFALRGFAVLCGFPASSFIKISFGRAAAYLRVLRDFRRVTRVMSPARHSSSLSLIPRFFSPAG